MNADTINEPMFIEPIPVH